MRRKRCPFLAAIYAASVHVGKAGGARVHNGYPREFFHPIFMGSLALRKRGVRSWVGRITLIRVIEHPSSGGDGIPRMGDPWPVARVARHARR